MARTLLTTRRTTIAPVEVHDATDSLLTFVRSMALVVVVLWHWVFTTIRWDGNGPHSGNPLHLVPGGFVLTWFLQVMPLFFIVGGWTSMKSYERSVARRAQESWVRKRIFGLVAPVLPLVGALMATKIFLSAWLFGVVLLAASPLWFLAVYVPLTILTPTLVRTHRRAPHLFLALSIGAVLAVQYARFALGVSGTALILLSFLGVWGTVYQLGFFFERVRNNRRLAQLCVSVGLSGIILGGAFGYSLSMVTRVNDTVSNMGPPTSQIVFLGLFQIGLVGVLQQQLRCFASRPRVERFIDAVGSSQMKIYAVHLPIWVAVLIALRNTPLALADRATHSWLALRPLWLLLPGAILFYVVKSSAMSRIGDECVKAPTAM